MLSYTFMVMVLTVIMLTGFVFWLMHFFDSPAKKKSLLIMPIFFLWPIVLLFYALAINIGNKKEYINDKTSI